jgi:hypothetical protein
MTTITATDRMDEVRRRLPDARQAMIAALGTMPSTAGGSGGSSGPSDRTGRLACAYLANEAIDPARRDLDALTMILWRARNRGHFTGGEIAAMLDLCDRWAPTPQRRRKIDDNLRAAADDLLNKTEDAHNCRSCKRDPGSWGEPARRGLCKSCIRYLDRCTTLYDVTLELPPVALVVALRERGKVTDADIHNAMIGQKRRD